MAAPKLQNEYKIDGDTTIIYLKDKEGNKYECYIDTEDYDKVKNTCWHLRHVKNAKGLYASGMKYLGKVDGKFKSKTLNMHRIILNLDKDDKRFIDHRNHNTLDNRKENLRFIENYQNTKYRKGKNSNNTSGYRNVSWINNHWVVQLQVNGKNTIFGRFDDVDEAGIFAELKRKEIYGKFAGK